MSYFAFFFIKNIVLFKKVSFLIFLSSLSRILAFFFSCFPLSCISRISGLLIFSQLTMTGMIIHMQVSSCAPHFNNPEKLIRPIFTLDFHQFWILSAICCINSVSHHMWMYATFSCFLHILNISLDYLAKLRSYSLFDCLCIRIY